MKWEELEESYSRDTQLGGGGYASGTEVTLLNRVKVPRADLTSVL